MKEGLWGLVSGTEAEPDTADRRATYAARRDTALAIIVLSHRDEVTLSGGGSCGAGGGLEETGQPVSEKIMGKQVGTQTQVVLHEADKWWVGAGTHKSYDRGAG